MKAVLAGAAIMLAAAASQAAAGRPGPAETIGYATGPCFGTCPDYRVTVSSDGRGVFEGRRFTAVVGRRAFRLSAAAFAEFRRRLRTARPEGEARLVPGQPACGSAATDQITVDVRWTGGGRPSHLEAYFGCAMERNARMFRALAHAPEALPILEMIGRR